jgi:hypothetical protein
MAGGEEAQPPGGSSGESVLVWVQGVGKVAVSGH